MRFLFEMNPKSKKHRIVQKQVANNSYFRIQFPDNEKNNLNLLGSAACFGFEQKA